MARTLIEVIGDNIRAQKSKPTKAGCWLAVCSRQVTTLALA
jgi:hypothetical protein